MNQLPEVAPEIPPDGYGLGVAGGGPGVNAALEIDGEWTIVVLANLDPPSATEVAARLRALTGAVVAHKRGSGEAQ